MVHPALTRLSCAPSDTHGARAKTWHDEINELCNIMLTVGLPPPQEVEPQCLVSAQKPAISSTECIWQDRLLRAFFKNVKAIDSGIQVAVIVGVIKKEIREMRGVMTRGGGGPIVRAIKGGGVLVHCCGGCHFRPPPYVSWASCCARGWRLWSSIFMLNPARLVRADPVSFRKCS